MKLEKFKFNNVFYKYRIFGNFAEHIEQLQPENVLPGWFDLFEVDPLEDALTCQERLFEKVGFGVKTLMTTRHFVDPSGEAWPQETFIVLEDTGENSRFALVVVIPQK